MFPNRAVAVVGLFAVWKIGAVYNPLNPRASDMDVTSALERVEPVLVMTVEEHAGRFAGRLMLSEQEGTWTLSGSSKTSQAPGTSRATEADGVALIQFTSGTTGQPKAVPMRHATVLDLIDRVISALRSTSRTAQEPPPRPLPNLIPVSVSLWGGIYQILFAFRAGAPVILMDRFDTLVFAQLVAEHQLRTTVLPPAALTMLVDDERIKTIEPLKRVRSITAPLAPIQARRFYERFGVVVLNAYGQTELGGEVVGWTSPDQRAFGLEKIGSVGRPHQGVSVRVVGEDGEPAAAGDTGELWVRTPSTAAGEVADSLSDRLDAEGWFRTGDVGSLDADGFVWVTGRVSDMINRGGLKVFPAEVEDVLVAFPGVIDASVVGAPDERLGEVPYAFVVTDDSPFSADELRDFSRARLSSYKVPVGFEVVSALPRNEVGKVLKRELIDRLRLTPTIETSDG